MAPNPALAAAGGGTLIASVWFGTEQLLDLNKVFTNIAFVLPPGGPCAVSWTIVPSDSAVAPVPSAGTTGTFSQVAGVYFDGGANSVELDFCARYSLNGHGTGDNGGVVTSHNALAIYTAALDGNATGVVTRYFDAPVLYTASLGNAAVFAGGPTITGVSPASGPPGGGQSVTITGTNFTSFGGTTVSFGATAGTSVVVNAAGTSLTVVTPAHVASAVNAVVTTVDGTGTLVNGYTYVAAPTVTAISPSSGSTDGGEAVIITGTEFTGAATLTIGGAVVASTDFTVDSATQISAVTPEGTAGQKDVVVTTVDGTGTLVNGYTYVAAPTVTAISPSSGSTDGGEAVIITGTDFTGAATLTIGGAVVASTDFTVDSPTQISAVTPEGTAGKTDVAVTTVGGTGTLKKGYTYVAPCPCWTTQELQGLGVNTCTYSASGSDYPYAHGWLAGGSASGDYIAVGGDRLKCRVFDRATGSNGTVSVTLEQVNACIALIPATCF